MSFGKTLRTEDHPICSQSPGSSMGPHDPSCNSLIFVLSFWYNVHVRSTLCNYILSFRPEAELVLELSCMCVAFNFQVTQRCWISSRIDEV